MPELGHHDVLVKVMSCGVCRTDLHFFEGVINPGKVPIVLGHEIAGKISDVGDGVTELMEGDRVVVYNYITCGRCRSCSTGWEPFCLRLRGVIGFTLDGGYAEYVRVPEQNLIKIPNGITFEEASVLVDAGATTFTAVTKVANVKPGEIVMVNGVGGLGLYAVQFAKICGAYVIAVDVVEEKLSYAKFMGADTVFNSAEQDVPREISKIAPNGADVVLEIAANKNSFTNAMACLGKKSRLVVLGYGADPLLLSSRDTALQGICILGSRASGRYELEQVVKLASRGLVKSAVTSVHALDDINNVLKKLERGELLGRAVIKP